MRLNNSSIKLSQSTLKGLGLRIVNNDVDDVLEYGKLCPRAFKHKVVDGNYPESKPMLEGIVLESNLLGSGNGKCQMELPPLVNGDPSTCMKRIWNHKKGFDKWCAANEITISKSNVQMPIVVEFRDKVQDHQVILSGVTDVFPITTNNGVIIIDIKYTTGRIDKLDFFMRKRPMLHDTCYANEDEFNYMQAVMYKYIVRRMNMKWLKRYWSNLGIEKEDDKFIYEWIDLESIQKNNIDFAWFIFSGAPYDTSEEGQLWKDHIPKAEDDILLEEVVRRGATRFLEWESKGWQERSCNDCTSCQLRTECKTFNKKFRL